jgi:hypothetical protein
MILPNAQTRLIPLWLRGAWTRRDCRPNGELQDVDQQFPTVSLNGLGRRLADRSAVSIAQICAALAIGLTILLPIVDVSSVLSFTTRERALFAIGATVLTLPLQLRHVVSGLRGVRPPAGIATLVVVAVVHALTTLTVGTGWMYSFAYVALSVLIVIPGRAAGFAYGAVVLSPLAFEGVLGSATSLGQLPGAI